MEATSGTWVKTIAIGGGGTRKERTPEEQRTWADRARGIRGRAEAVLLKYGARAEDFRHGTPSERLIDAARSFWTTLSEEQLAAAAPASRTGETSPGTVIDLFEAIVVREDDFVPGWDEAIPCAEALWPAESGQ